MAQKKVLIPLPSFDFDPTEAAVPWKIIKQSGFEVVFSTPDGQPASADPMMLSGEGLDPWGWIPGLKKIRFIGLFLRADHQGRKAYGEMQSDPNFLAPISHSDLVVEDYAGLVIPGGHAPRMKQYLEDKTLQQFIADFFDATDDSGHHKPVAAVCHGVVLLARSISKKTRQSVLFGKKTTALTWKLEKSAWDITRYFARFWDPNYYRTYMESASEPTGYQSVEQEIKRALKTNNDFLDVPKDADHYHKKASGLFRDSVNNTKPAWVVEDGNYLSARWPGDVHTLSSMFVKKLEQ